MITGEFFLQLSKFSDEAITLIFRSAISDKIRNLIRSYTTSQDKNGKPPKFNQYPLFNSFFITDIEATNPNKFTLNDNPPYYSLSL